MVRVSLRFDWGVRAAYIIVRVVIKVMVSVRETIMAITTKNRNSNP